MSLLVCSNRQFMFSRITLLLIGVGEQEILCNAIYEQTLYGNYGLGAFSNEEKATLIKYGLARTKTRGAAIDEPPIILAVLQLLNHRNRLSMFRCLRRDIDKHQPGKEGFEAYLAYYLRKIFETAPRLDSVFSLRSDFMRRNHQDLEWQHEEFELVTVGAANSNTPNVSVVKPSFGPSCNVGFMASDGDEVLEWISINDDQFAFCFPPESFGPNLLFFIRSKVSRKLLLVMAQARWYKKMEKQDLIHGIRAVSPSWLWKSKAVKVCFNFDKLLALASIDLIVL